MLLTNDGDLAASLTHPRHGVARVYEARVLGVPDDHDLDRLQKGVVIDGQKTGPADVKALAPRAPARRRPRRTEPAGPEDVRRHRPSGQHLKRVAIGPIQDSRLKPGQWRELSEAEVKRLRAASAAADAAPSTRTKDQGRTRTLGTRT